MEKKGSLSGCHSAGAPLGSAGEGQAQLSPCGCCAPGHSLGTDSVPTPEWHLQECRALAGREGGRRLEGGSDSSTGISAQEIPHVLGMRNALCQALF